MEKKAAACIPFIGTSYFSSSFVSDTDETKKKKKEIYGKWSELPALPIKMVYDQLDFVETFRFASVCVQWRVSAPDFARHRPQQLIPWFLFSHDTKTEEVGFFNLPENMIHHVRLLPQINMNLCCGSTEGWLFMFADAQDDPCFLLNPFTKARIQLPSFSIELQQSVRKVILSCSPDINEDWMVVAYIASRGLLFCKSGDKSWSIGPPKSKIAFSFDEGDIVFSGGEVYALGMLNSIWVFDMKTQKHSLMGGGVTPPYDLGHNDDAIERDDKYISYLVESNGELFLVARFLKNIIGKNSSESENGLPESVDDQGQADSDDHYKTFKFLLYKLEGNDNENLRREYVWVRQSSFGVHQALFLSKIGSKSVSTIESPGLRSNSIYFTNDLHPQIGKHCDIGIYHVEDDQIEPFISFDSYDFKFPSVWVTPSV